jgi:hypothetical protein
LRFRLPRKFKQILFARLAQPPYPNLLLELKIALHNSQKSRATAAFKFKGA